MTIFVAAGGSMTAPALGPGVLGSGGIALAGRYAVMDLNNNGTATTQNSYLKFDPVDNATSVILPLPNPSDNAITVTAGVESPAGAAAVAARTPAGATSIVIQPGKLAFMTAVLDVTKASGKIAVRTHVAAATHVPWTHQAETGEAVEQGSGLADKSLTGTINNTATAGYGPLAVLYRPTSYVPSWCIVGDSQVSDLGFENNWARRACEGNVSLLVAGQGGATTASFMDAVTSPIDGYLPYASLVPATSGVICQFGTNNLKDNTTTADKAPWIALWRLLAARGQKVLQSTVTPRNDNGNNTAQGVVRGEANAWFRDGSPISVSTGLWVPAGSSGAIRAGDAGHPLIANSTYPHGCIDVAATVEASTTSYTWQSGMDADGIHYSATGNIAAAAACITAGLT